MSLSRSSLYELLPMSSEQNNFPW